MGTFLNPKTRKMKHLSVEQREQCIEYIKQEMLLFDNDNSSKLPTTRKDSQLSINHPIKSINDFYSNAEDNDEDDIDQQSALRSSSHALEIELYTKKG
ncbi:unnamed protein product [Rotaria sp. Silwood1]|nr:unnamed protein product [Rotaria sp. Silwood1]CAF1447645.1 unnamed protein product [Rotaria sp. Silwood1]